MLYIDTQIRLRDEKEPCTQVAVEKYFQGLKCEQQHRLVGEGEGVVVVPSWFAEECVQVVEDHESVEAYVKMKIEQDNVPPGRYYPPSPEMWEEWRATQK